VQRISSSLCAVRVARTGGISTDGERPLVLSLDAGIIIYAFDSGICVLDCEGYSSTASVEIPWPIMQGQKLSSKFARAEDLIEARIFNRVRVLNCFLACINSAMSKAQAQSVPTNDEVTLDNYLSIPFPRENLRNLTSRHFEHHVRNLPAFRTEPKNFEIGKEALSEAARLLDQVMKDPDLIVFVDLIYKARDAYRRSDFPSSCVQAWGVCESILRLLWRRYLSGVPAESNGSKMRVSKTRMQQLAGKHGLNAATTTQILELLELLPFDLYERCNRSREIRNGWIHSLQSPTDENASAGVQLAQDMVDLAYQIPLQVSLQRGHMF
jgi:hypothetical protein